MKNNNLVLGIDTSNYTTSVALTDRDGNTILDLRKPLEVKQGERGLRQSHALFQHMENLPVLLGQALDDFAQEICAVAVSHKPRPVEGSYMPVFNGGLHFGEVVAKSLQKPLFRFSHQEGHLAAASFGTELFNSKTPYLAWHLSGGTCELLLVEGASIQVIGGSKDLSFGQLIDRVGVAMGFSFPCGRQLDEGACAGAAKGNPLKPIPRDGLYFNVSGMETHAQRIVAEGKEICESLPFYLFQRMAQCLAKVTAEAAASTGTERVLFMGGVSASTFLRGCLKAELKGLKAGMLTPVFGAAALSSDNAVGTSLMGGQALWH